VRSELVQRNQLRYVRRVHRRVKHRFAHEFGRINRVFKLLMPWVQPGDDHHDGGSISAYGWREYRSVNSHSLGSSR
jgi:hypothetical protein